MIQGSIRKEKQKLNSTHHAKRFNALNIKVKTNPSLTHTKRFNALIAEMKTERMFSHTQKDSRFDPERETETELH